MEVKVSKNGKISEKNISAAHLEEARGTPVEKHCSRQSAV